MSQPANQQQQQQQNTQYTTQTTNTNTNNNKTQQQNKQQHPTNDINTNIKHNIEDNQNDNQQHQHQQQQKQKVDTNRQQQQQQGYQHIADKMLRQLQQEYQNTHKYNTSVNMHEQQPNYKQDNQNNDNEDKDEDDQYMPEGYQNLDNYCDDNNLNSDSDEEQDDGDKDDEREDREEKDKDGDNDNNGQIKQQQNIDTYINTDINTISSFQSPPTINPQTLQLIQVGPVPESVFEVPEPPSHDINIDVDKIKCFALSLNIEAPDWAKDPLQMESKIRQLFQKHPMHNNSGDGNKVGDFQKKKIDGK